MLFVYGTLRAGAPNSDRVHGPVADAMRAAPWRGRGAIGGRLHWVNWYPGVIESDAPGERVVGDVFELPDDPALWAAIDEYESASVAPLTTGEYVRKRTTVQLDNGQTLDAWVYVYNRPENLGRRIENGDFLSEKSAPQKP